MEVVEDATAQLTVLFQVGLAVAAGVLIDTFVVRSILVPAITTVAGDRAWWPSGMRTAFAPRAWRLVTAPGSREETENVIAGQGGKRAAELRAKAARYPQLRVFRASDTLYFVFFDAGGVVVHPARTIARTRSCLRSAGAPSLACPDADGTGFPFTIHSRRYETASPSGSLAASATLATRTVPAGTGPSQSDTAVGPGAASAITTSWRTVGPSTSPSFATTEG